MSDERTQTSANALALARAERGLTVRSLAALSGVNASTISQIETARRGARLITLHKLAEALNVDIGRLMSVLDTSAPARGRKGAATKQRAKVAPLPSAPVAPAPLETIALDRPRPPARRGARGDKVGLWLIDIDGDIYPVGSKDEGDRLSSKFKGTTWLYGPCLKGEAEFAHRKFMVAMSNKGIDWREVKG